jgi:amidohydrolase
MAAEDFSEYSIRIPGCYFFVGARNEAVDAVHPHHSPHFNVCEKGMALGLEVLDAAAARYLAAE